MIAYEVLVQTIADWKAGVRPTAPTPPQPMGAPEQVDEVASGVVDFDEELSFASEDDEGEAQPEAEYGYDESEYQQPVDTYQDDDDELT
jgi:hypothetical protein